ncbi:MAG TPA: prepilin-type N-terminal cleavage/methylation domain-containing protein [Gemmatimonadaceae bacterium]|nr:prepilin-type N-terminal cleavage/methylation domain-containing protein [Gemmatimonadaceae bacterium]
MRAARAGVTLIELIVVIALLGLIAGMTTVSMRADSGVHSPSLAQRIASARRDAIRTGQPTELAITDSVGTHVLRALPDGRVLGEPSTGVDVTTGELRDAR